MVEGQKLTIYRASKLLKMNYATAKTILQLYKKTGRIDKHYVLLDSSEVPKQPGGQTLSVEKMKGKKKDVDDKHHMKPEER